MDIIYLITNDGAAIFTTSDANKAVAKSIELIQDQHGHDLEVWVDGKKSGKIDLVL